MTMTTVPMIQKKGERRKTSLAQPLSGLMLAPDADGTPSRTRMTESCTQCASGQGTNKHNKAFRCDTVV